MRYHFHEGLNAVEIAYRICAVYGPERTCGSEMICIFPCRKLALKTRSGWVARQRTKLQLWWMQIRIWRSKKSRKFSVWSTSETLVMWAERMCGCRTNWTIGICNSAWMRFAARKKQEVPFFKRRYEGCMISTRVREGNAIFFLSFLFIFRHSLLSTWYT